MTKKLQPNYKNKTNVSIPPIDNICINSQSNKYFIHWRPGLSVCISPLHEMYHHSI